MPSLEFFSQESIKEYGSGEEEGLKIASPYR